MGTVPAQNTGMGPEKTSFFQALNIPTKISRGTIEILNDVLLLKPGDKVGASEATLLNMLNISPFTYGLVIEQVYDSGTIFEPSILDITDDDLRKRFLEGVVNLACVSLAIGYPTLASIPHVVINGFKNLLAVAAVTDIEFKEAETVKEYLKDPSKFVSAAPVAAAAVEEKKEKQRRWNPKRNLKMMTWALVCSIKLETQIKKIFIWILNWKHRSRKYSFGSANYIYGMTNSI